MAGWEPVQKADSSTERRGAVDRALQEWRALYGLDKPLHMQYLIWLKNLFTLDFGISFKDSQPVWGKIVERLPATIKLNVLSTVLVYLVAIPLGIYSAYLSVFLWRSADHVRRLRLVRPTLVLGGDNGHRLSGWRRFLLLVPAGGLQSVNYSPGWPWWQRLVDQGWHLCLPVLMLSYGGFAGLSRFMRSSMLENLRQDFVLVARSKGLAERVVIYKHVLRNSLIPIVTIMASIIPGLVAAASLSRPCSRSPASAN